MKMPQPPRRLLVIGSLALVSAGPGQLAVEHSNRRLGDVLGTVAPFRVDGKLVLAGPKERRDHHMTVIVTPTDDGTPYPVKVGGWMTPPLEPPNGPITMIAQDRGGRELFRVAVDPNRPTYGPDWVGYVPLDDDK